MLQRPGLAGVVLLLLAMVVLQWVGPEALRYQPVHIAGGELWRLVTGHWVHANWVHLGLNAAGLVLCWALTEVAWKPHQWGWRIVVLSLGISALMMLFGPDSGWYVGFSGVLFGLYVLAAIDSLPRQRMMASALLAIIGVKIILDMMPSVNMNSSDLIGVPVLVEAHLYGVVVALMIVVLGRVLGLFSIK